VRHPKLIGESHVDAAAFLIEEDIAISEGEKSVISSHANIRTGMPLGSALANEDVASDDNFAAEFLYAKALAVGVASVFDGTLSFFMGHK
jgi:hypothetical protein